LGLVSPWEVEKVELDTTRRRIDFEVRCTAKTLTCPHCGAAEQRIHDRLRRAWRHLDLFQYEAWLHADVPRVACTACVFPARAGMNRSHRTAGLPHGRVFPARAAMNRKAQVQTANGTDSNRSCRRSIGAARLDRCRNSMPTARPSAS
jgi:transposase